MGNYASLDIVRKISGISTTEMSDDTLSSICSLAVGMFNLDIAVEVGGADEEYELLTPASEDATDTIFYTKHHPLIDMNGDCTFAVDTSLSISSDVLCYDDVKQNLPSVVTVASIEYKTGKVTLNAATTDSVYAHYMYCAKEMDSQEFQIAFAYLCASLAWDNLHGTVLNISKEGLSVTRSNYFRNLYRKAVSQLNAALSCRVSESPKRIVTPDHFVDPDEGLES